ncbi:flagellar assembly protein FliH [Psychrosphaera sp. 1_MG-2023]|uniref:flagellar assembly protein FliH n=1 Tax=Psychrosphaera sp. 1_MG-2023 TaxID=3062643 RepID=UPI0026E365CF|nr:flagellar assembly protein FliH [Psychrosphaera sp. 1_MG-2023]MDO6718436.1 flagellar assembly protein FliH [Psychrosphaera sp. 1_MG-2023]
MSDKLSNNPVTPSDDMLELLKDWVAPDVTAIKREELKGKTNFMGVPINEMYSRLKKQEEEIVEELPQLTAEEIEKIRQDAYDEGIEQGKKDGFEAGFEEGKTKGHEEGMVIGIEEGNVQGLAEGQQKIEELAMQWQQLIDQLYEPIKRVDKAVELQLLELAVALAEGVIRTETKMNQDVLLNILHESVASLPFNTEFAELHLHPSDIETIKSIYDEDTLIERKWILKEEPAYTQGDLVVGTPNSLIDRTVKQRMKQTIGDFVQAAALEKEHANSPIPLAGDLAPGINMSESTDQNSDAGSEAASDQNQVEETSDANAVDEQPGSPMQKKNKNKNNKKQKQNKQKTNNQTGAIEPSNSENTDVNAVDDVDNDTESN